MTRAPWWQGREPKFSARVPAGFQIDYVEWERKPHNWRKYLIDGEPCVSVTEALGFLDGGKSDGFAYAAARIWLAGVCAVLDESFVDDRPDLTPEEWEAELKDRNLLHTDIWGAKAKLGTDAHDLFERLCMEADFAPDLNTIPADLHGYVRGFCSWFSDAEPEVLNAEMLVGSREHRYAGRFDLLYRDRDGKTVLADLKSSSQVRDSYHAQLQAYCIALEECGYGRPDRSEIIHVTPSGEYTVHDGCAEPDEFLTLLAAYHKWGELQARIKAATKADEHVTGARAA